MTHDFGQLKSNHPCIANRRGLPNNRNAHAEDSQLRILASLPTAPVLLIEQRLHDFPFFHLLSQPNFPKKLHDEFATSLSAGSEEAVNATMLT
jgi:hypothetical protein